MADLKALLLVASSSNRVFFTLLHVVAAGLFLLALTGCTSNSPGETGSPVESPARTAPVRMLALGDSYTIGESVGKLEDWPIQLVRDLRVRGIGAAEPVVIAATGWTTGDLIRSIDAADPAGPFDLVTLQIGVNNQFRNGTIEVFETELSDLTATAIRLAGGNANHVLLISIPDWGVTPFAVGAPTAEIAAEIDEFNSVIRVQATESGTRFLNVTEISRRAPAEPELIAPDGLHPSGLMYAEWVRLFVPEVLEIIE